MHAKIRLLNCIRRSGLTSANCQIYACLVKSSYMRKLSHLKCFIMINTTELSTLICRMLYVYIIKKHWFILKASLYLYRLQLKYLSTNLIDEASGIQYKDPDCSKWYLIYLRPCQRVVHAELEVHFGTPMPSTLKCTKFYK